MSTTNTTGRIGYMRNLVRERISPRLTSFYARLGFANRNVLSQNLRTLNPTNADALLDRLAADGILKNSFRGRVSTLQDLQSFMLSGRVDRVRVNRFTTGAREIIPGSAEALDHLATGVFAVQSNLIPALINNPTSQAVFSMALALGAGSAVVIGGTLLGIPATYTLGAGTVGSLISAVLVNRVDPNTKLGKLVGIGSRLLPLMATATMTYASWITFGHGFMFMDAMSEAFGNVPLYLLGGAAGLTAALTIKDISRAISSNLGFLRSFGKGHIAKNVAYSNLKVLTGVNYLAYRTVLFAAFTIGALSFHFSGFSWLALGIGAAARLATSTVQRERLTEKIWTKTAAAASRVLNKPADKQINEENNPMAKMGVEFAASLAIKYGALIGAGALLVADPAALIFDLATIYTGYWTLFADWHSGTASIGSAWNWKRSMVNPEAPFISDADLRKTNNFTARMIAYMGEAERNFSKVVNMLIMETPHVEVEFCGGEGEYPFAGLPKVKNLRGAREVHQLMADWRDDIYRRFQTTWSDYQAKRIDVRTATTQLAATLENLGWQMADLNRPDSYVRRIRDLMVAEKGKFSLEGDEPFVRQAYEAVRIRGYRYLEMARDIRGMEKAGVFSAPEVEYMLKEMLGIFSVNFNHVLRKIDYLDDRLGTKTANLSWPETHMGDTLYQAWQLVSKNGKEALQASYLPSSYVRLKNPSYNHLTGAKAENKRYIWIRREDFLSILGVSEAMSNQFSLVDNTPANIAAIERRIEIHAGHERLTVRGFVSDRELLPPNHLLDWEGNTVPLNADLWIAGQAAPAGFTARFTAWAEQHYGADAYQKWRTQLIKTGKAVDPLWFIDRPEALVLAPNEYYNVCDEAYIVINTERVLAAEINHSAQKDVIGRVVNYEESQVTMPNPDPRRPVNLVAAWTRQDSPVGFRYRTTDGRSFNIPYPENRLMFVEGVSGEAWKEISYGLIVPDGRGGEMIEVYNRAGKRMGTINTEWPHHLHPSSLIEGKRIEIDVFADRVGMATWLVADYGNNFGPRRYDRYRFSFLDFDLEAKKQFWPNFITGLELSADQRQITFRSLSTNCESFPFDKRWANIRSADAIDVLQMETSNQVYLDPQSHTWSPVSDAAHFLSVKSGDLLLLRNARGQEQAIAASGLPSLDDLRRTVDVVRRGKKLELVQLRSADPSKDYPHFVYSLPPELVENDPQYQKLKWLLDKQDLTVKVKPAAGGYELELFDEQGNLVPGLTLRAADLRDNNGNRFLRNWLNHMSGVASFFQRDDNDYTGAEEYRPRLMNVNGRIKLVLTRVVRSSYNPGRTAMEAIAAFGPTRIMASHPTSAVQIRDKRSGAVKWVPLSLVKPVNYHPIANRATFGVAVNGQMRYFNAPLAAELPPLTYVIEYDRGLDRFFAVTLAPQRLANGFVDIIPTRSGAVSAEAEAEIRTTLQAQGLTAFHDVKIDVFHVRQPELINGEWHSVVHGQRQHGVFYKDETYAPAEQAQFRDEYFYGIVDDLFSESFPPTREPRSGGLQLGKTWDFDANRQYSGKPIENGTQFVGNHRHLFELAEVLMGVPKGGLIAYAASLGRNGGFERMLGHKEHFKKLCLYCREKGWLSGVSEDEQGVLSLALALGYRLKYHVRVTAFEAQPNTYGQVDGQDARRYNTALALGQDVLIPFEGNELKKWAAGKPIAGTWKQKLEHLLFRAWYEWPKAELARELSPAIFLLSNGRIKPYIVDPYFLASYAADFGAGMLMYTHMRKMLGRTGELSGHDPLWWSMLRGPAMNQSFFFQSTRGILELFRKGWQYGQFVVTAQQKDNAQIADVNKKFLEHVIALQLSSTAYGALMTIPGALALGASPITLGYGFNYFWSLYSSFINYKSLGYIAECETSHPKATTPEAQAWKAQRDRTAQDINGHSDEIGTRFFEGYRAYISGDVARATEIWRDLIETDDAHKIMNYVKLAEENIEKLGTDLDGVPRGRLFVRRGITRRFRQP
jgi:hypothetical protein